MWLTAWAYHLIKSSPSCLEYGGGLHQRKLPRPDEMVRFLRVREVEADEIRFLEQPLEGDRTVRAVGRGHHGPRAGPVCPAGARSGGAGGRDGGGRDRVVPARWAHGGHESI